MPFHLARQRDALRMDLDLDRIVRDRHVLCKAIQGCLGNVCIIAYSIQRKSNFNLLGNRVDAFHSARRALGSVLFGLVRGVPRERTRKRRSRPIPAIRVRTCGQAAEGVKGQDDPHLERCR